MSAEARPKAIELMLRSLQGASLKCLEHPAEGLWHMDFAAGLTTECPSRIIASNKVALGDSDHGQKLGLPEPIDDPSATLRLLAGTTLQEIEIDSVTAGRV